MTSAGIQVLLTLNARGPRRWFDGRVRHVVSARHVEVTGSHRIRVELLSCGHEKAFEARGTGISGPKGPGQQHRVCHECPEGEPDGRRPLPEGPQGARPAGGARPAQASPPASADACTASGYPPLPAGEAFEEEEQALWRAYRREAEFVFGAADD